MEDLLIDVIGADKGAMGWVTHSLGFYSALKEIVPTIFHSSHVNPHDGNNSKRRADFGVVIFGTPIDPNRSARWILWETTKLPQSQLDLCASTRFLWTPSSWGREVLIANGIAPSRIAVIPEGVDSEFFRPGAQSSGRFRFLSVGKWENRKFTEGLLRAFADEFHHSEPVELYLHAHNPYISNFSVRDRIAKLGLPSNSNIIVGDVCSAKDLRALYQSARCFVLPTRAEGWGLPILESMSCGVPPIVTNYSAQVDYISENNSFPLKVKQMIEARDDEFGIHTGSWADPDVEHLRYLMRFAFNNPELLITKGRHARQTAEALSWRNSALLAIDFINNHIHGAE